MFSAPIFIGVKLVVADNGHLKVSKTIVLIQHAHFIRFKKQQQVINAQLASLFMLSTVQSQATHRLITVAKTSF